MTFLVDNRIQSTSIWIGDSSLSSVYIKNDRQFLWFVLVPRVENITEIFQLSAAERQVLIEEIAKFSKVVNEFCKPDKLNVGALGNIVSQLHFHVIARFEGDVAWPHGVWHSSCTALPYDNAELNRLVAYWRESFELPDSSMIVEVKNKLEC